MTSHRPQALSRYLLPVQTSQRSKWSWLHRSMNSDVQLQATVLSGISLSLISEGDQNRTAASEMVPVLIMLSSRMKRSLIFVCFNYIVRIIALSTVLQNAEFSYLYEHSLRHENHLHIVLRLLIFKYSKLGISICICIFHVLLE